MTVCIYNVLYFIATVFTVYTSTCQLPQCSQKDTVMVCPCEGLYLVPLKTMLPQPLCSSHDLPQWQLELAPCEAHLHLWVVFTDGVMFEMYCTVRMVNAMEHLLKLLYVYTRFSAVVLASSVVSLLPSSQCWTL